MVPLHWRFLSSSGKECAPKKGGAFKTRKFITMVFMYYDTHSEAEGQLYRLLKKPYHKFLYVFVFP